LGGPLTCIGVNQQPIKTIGWLANGQQLAASTAEWATHEGVHNFPHSAHFLPILKQPNAFTQYLL
jgi:hypothetical protein